MPGELKQAVIDAAERWAAEMVIGTEESRDEAGLTLLDAVNALKAKEDRHGDKKHSD